VTARLPIYWITCALLVLNLLTPWAGHAERQESDVFNSSGPYDRYAVGGAHRWYDNHSTETKQKSSPCLSILDEAKVYQDKALALYEEARRPGNSKRQTELVKQANEQIRRRGKSCEPSQTVSTRLAARKVRSPIHLHPVATGHLPILSRPNRLLNLLPFQTRAEEKA
jgi:hypothetical protein